MSFPSKDDHYARIALRAFSYSPPDLGAELLLAQLPLLDEEAGVVLAKRLIEFVPAGSWAWQLSDEALDRWPAVVAGFVMAHVRAIPPGPTRVEALCLVPRRLTAAERRQALDGILAGALPPGPGVGPREIARFVRSLPDTWKEEWLARELARPLDPSADADAEVAGIEREVRARNAAGLWPEDAESALRSRIEALPPEKGAGLAGLPWRPDPPAPRLDDLSVEERVALVRNPRDKSPDGVADHLERLAQDPASVSMGEWQRWHHHVRHFAEKRPRHRSLIALASLLDGDHRKRAIEEAVAIAHHMADWPASPGRWELIPARDRWRVASGLARRDAEGRKIDGLIGYLLRELPPEEADDALKFVTGSIYRARHDRGLSTLISLTPWLADRSGGAFPRAIAAGPFSPPRRPPRRDERTLRRLGRL